MYKRSLSIRIGKFWMKRFFPILINVATANTSAFFCGVHFLFGYICKPNPYWFFPFWGGTYMFCVTLSSMLFGTIVDKYKKNRVITLHRHHSPSLERIGCVLHFEPKSEISQLSSPSFWLFSMPLLWQPCLQFARNSIVHYVSILVEKENYARANGLIGILAGIGMIANTVSQDLSSDS